jgi:hypothetical protein
MSEAAGKEGVEDLLAGSTDELVARTRGATRILILNRPNARNAMSRVVRESFARLMAEADADPEVRVVIITGVNGVFSAGVDLKENPAGVILPLVRPHPVEVTRAMSKPVVAMVDGPCVTGGLEVALASPVAWRSPWRAPSSSRPTARPSWTRTSRSASSPAGASPRCCTPPLAPVEPGRCRSPASSSTRIGPTIGA